MSSYENYCYHIDELRSSCVASMRGRFPGWFRDRVNRKLHWHCHYSYKHYLWFFDKTCQLCGHDIVAFRQITMDHIVPKAQGGEDKNFNMQLAHARCNVRKGDRLDYPKPPLWNYN